MQIIIIVKLINFSLINSKYIKSTFIREKYIYLFQKEIIIIFLLTFINFKILTTSIINFIN